MNISDLLSYPFTWGLLLGLVITGFVWKMGFTTRGFLKKEIKRLENEMRDLQTHLNTQLKINASGNQAVQSELENLRQQNENLRLNLAELQKKPGKAEMRTLQVYELAVSELREHAPGFASAWEKSLRDADAKMQDSEFGWSKIVRKITHSMPLLNDKTHSIENE
jgi:biopolymer transport protein ExbB/TolQ